MAEAVVNDVTLSYRVLGDPHAEAVLLVCGTGQAASSWDVHQVPLLLSGGYRVVTFDNRGLPPSSCPPPPYSVADMVEDTAGLIEQLDLGPCRVVGYSLGAFVTQELALARPELVRAAVMLGTLGRQDLFRRAAFRSWVELDRSGVELPRFYDVVSSSFFLLSPRTLDDEEAMREHLEANVATPAWSGPGKLGQHEADASYDGRLGALSKLRVPSMVVGFELDMIVPAHLGKEVADAIPGCRYVEIPGAAHAGPFEEPVRLHELLMEFFEQS